jgi:hypothetical protein
VRTFDLNDFFLLFFFVRLLNLSKIVRPAHDSYPLKSVILSTLAPLASKSRFNQVSSITTGFRYMVQPKCQNLLYR